MNQPVITTAAFHYGNKLRRKASREVHNDAKRKAWLDGDEGLYNAWQRSKKTKDAFVRANRTEIDKVIDVVNSGTKPAHYLAYGG
jgi:hypothetical protein